MKAEPTAPWQSGRISGPGSPTLLFGRMHEDWEIELDALPPTGTVFCIASAGCTAFALAQHGYRVTAVDINPAQVNYVRQRIAGVPASNGTIDDLMARGRRWLWLLGLRRSKVLSFLQLDDPEEQTIFWQQHLNTRRLRTAMSIILHPRVLHRIYDSSLVRGIPAPFAPVLMARLERGWSIHANRSNPYAWRMLLGQDPPVWRQPAPVSDGLTLECADAAEYLERCPPNSFDGLTLSNVLDASRRGYRDRLLEAVNRAGRPGAAIVLRSFSEPEDLEAKRRAEQDRSLLWGSIQVSTV